MSKPETCRDLLRDMLATGSNISDFDDLLDFHGFSTDRIRAAIAAVDAELERVATGGDRVKALAWMMLEQWAKTAATESRSTAEAAAARLVRDVMPGWFNAARIDLGTGIDRYGLMRQLDAAQRIAGEMPELRRKHARMAVDGDLMTQDGLARAEAYRERRFAAIAARSKIGGRDDG